MGSDGRKLDEFVAYQEAHCGSGLTSLLRYGHLQAHHHGLPALVWCGANIAGYRNGVQNREWLEFRCDCETSCLYQILHAGHLTLQDLHPHFTNWA